MVSDHELIDALGCWQGYRAGLIEAFVPPEPEMYAEVWIELHPLTDEAVCDGCGQTCSAIHEYAEHWLRDLPLFGHCTWLLLHVRRVKCPNCGPKRERICWLAPDARMTERLARQIAALARQLPITAVAEFYHVGWDAAKRVHKRRLQEELPEPDWDNIHHLAMDEFAIQKGHRYATVIVDPVRKQVLWVGRGRGREDVKPFFEARSQKWCQSLRAVAMDMTAAYANEVAAHCPNAEVVYDLFHVVAKYGREVVDRVRVDEAKRLKEDEPARKVVKGSRWLLLRNAGNLSDDQAVRLRELLAANEALATVYILKDDLKHLWDYKYAAWARRFWEGWKQRALDSGLPSLRRFAEKLEPYLPGIFAHCRYPLHTSLLEGINNTIKVIKRTAYGYRDDDYFFLQIRAAFPGKTG